MYRFGLFGATPDTPNMGVSALFASVVYGLRKNIADSEFTVFSNDLNVSQQEYRIGDKTSVKIRMCGARGGRKFYSGHNLHTAKFCSKLGAVGRSVNPILSEIEKCDAVFDISGGDSFTDLYGRKRFDNITIPKICAINRKKPLILLPQTYGPFHSKESEHIAANILKRSTFAWARDEYSFNYMREMLGADFDQGKHKSGVDVAFGLETATEMVNCDRKFAALFSERAAGTKFVGINVSGLIFNDREMAKSRYGFKASYNDVLKRFVAWMLDREDVTVVLIPHVMSEPGHYESDYDACCSLREALPPEAQSRILVAPRELDQFEVKFLISKMSWFCGTRMHSTVAAMSSEVPTVSIAYSDKTKGVFESAGLGNNVVDPRLLDTDETLKQLQALYSDKKKTTPSAGQDMDTIRLRSANQMREIVSDVLHILA